MGDSENTPQLVDSRRDAHRLAPLATCCRTQSSKNSASEQTQRGTAKGLKLSGHLLQHETMRKSIRPTGCAGGKRKKCTKNGTVTTLTSCVSLTTQKNMVHRENLAAERRKLITETQNDFGGVIHLGKWQHLRARREKSRRQKAEEAAAKKNKRAQAQNLTEEEKNKQSWEDITRILETSDDDNGGLGIST